MEKPIAKPRFDFYRVPAFTDGGIMSQTFLWYNDPFRNDGSTGERALDNCKCPLRYPTLVSAETNMNTKPYPKGPET